VPGLAYKRILLKLSGEALEGDGEEGCIDFDALGVFCGEIAEAHRLGAEIGLVVGGGNIYRGGRKPEDGVDKPTGDYMGMLATVINALALQACLEKRNVSTRVMTAIEMRPVAEPYIRRRATRHLEKGRVVIFGGGTGNPYFSTDTAAALRATEIGADVVIKATKVDGIYDKDPITHPEAVQIKKLTYLEILARRINVMDSTAVTLCMENNLPILVLDLWKPGDLMRAIYGEEIGTLVDHQG